MTPPNIRRKAMEVRRLVARALLGTGAPQACVARRLRVSRASISRWARCAPEDLKLRVATGRPCRVSTKDLEAIVARRLQWTRRQLIEEIFQSTGVRYSLDHAGRLLRRAGA